jgi:hypothetical protein
MIIETGSTGIPLRTIINQLGNKSYSYIECRCKWIEDDELYDIFCGSCSYNSKTKELTALDSDSYSLEDLYNEWEEYSSLDGSLYLTVWECGTIVE